MKKNKKWGVKKFLSTEVGEVGTSESIPEPGSWRKPTMEEKEEMIRSFNALISSTGHTITENLGRVEIDIMHQSGSFGQAVGRRSVSSAPITTGGVGHFLVGNFGA